MLLFGLGLPACRKSEDDPFLSLRTRKNRLTGEWKVERYEKFTDHGAIRWIRYQKDTGLIYQRVDSSTYSRPFTWSFTFKGDGSYRSEKREDFPADSSESGNAYSLYTTENGEWKFTGGNGVPNKSEVVFLTEEVLKARSDQGSNIDIVSVSDPVNGEVYKINRLSNKELWMSYAFRTSFPFYSERDSLIVRFLKH